ncbi:MAG: guanylate kinase [Oscillospiraceae bacterium]
MKNNGLLIVISGPSGVGKGTVLAEYRKTHDNLHMSVSATTRNPRPGEIDGKDYYFISREKFDTMVAQGEMFEYAIYGDNCYGTPKKPVEEKIKQGIDVILEIEVQGAMQVRNASPEAVLIFIMPPSFEVLKNRLVGRNTETIEAVNKRLSAAQAEISSAGDYDFVILNDDVDRAVAKLSAVIEAARYSGERIRWLVDAVSKTNKN